MMKQNMKKTRACGQGLSEGYRVVEELKIKKYFGFYIYSRHNYALLKPLPA